MRARQDRRKDSHRNEVLPLLLHGDAAFAGQGVVMETFNLSQTRGYSTGGSLHVIVNNQIGVTTSEPLDSRSTLYCTDVAKMIQAPIFHVNADDPDAVAKVAKIALDFRMEFNKDVIIDLICYRKHGHSETDEPATTQPIMYKKIRNHLGTETIYAEKLISDGVLREGEAVEIREQYIRALEDNQVVSRPYAELLDNSAVNYFLPFLKSNWESDYNSALAADTISKLGTKFTQVPPKFKLHRQSKRILEDRKAMFKGDSACDWGFAETLAYASLLSEGCPVRISGQDCGRGTFSHRHAVLNDQNNGEAYLPSKHR